MTYRLTECRVCQHVYCVEDSDYCPKCAAEHQAAGRRNVVGSPGHKVPARTLDMQEGNWSEWN